MVIPSKSVHMSGCNLTCWAPNGQNLRMAQKNGHKKWPHKIVAISFLFFFGFLFFQFLCLFPCDTSYLLLFHDILKCLNSPAKEVIDKSAVGRVCSCMIGPCPGVRVEFGCACSVSFRPAQRGMCNSTVPQGHRHRVTTVLENVAEPSQHRAPQKPSMRPSQRPLRSKLPGRASVRVVPHGW